MTKRSFTLTTCVWGDEHIGVMASAMLPTLLAPLNLPELAKSFDLTYRISTTHHDGETLKKLPAMSRIARHAKVEFIFTEERAPASIHHINWYQRAIADARADGSLLAVVPPDVIWSNNTFGSMGRRMAEGYLGTAMPYLRVISETIAPEIAAMPLESNGSLDIPGGEVLRLGIKHLHPLTAVAVSENCHGRPSLEMIWPVGSEGFLLRHVNRELFSFDPKQLDLTEFWYAGSKTRPDDIHVVSDSDDMLMLSFAPLSKDIPILLQDRPITAFDVAKSSLHPLNDTPLSGYFAQHYVRLHYGAMTPRLWQSVEQTSDVVYEAVLATRDITQIWQALRQTERCTVACRLISAALYGADLARRWPLSGPVTMIVPTDQAFAGRNPWPLLAEGAKEHFLDWLLKHVASGAHAPGNGLQYAASIEGRALPIVNPSAVTSVGETRLLLVDDLPIDFAQ